MAEEGSVQLQIQNQMNEAVKARSTLLNTQTKILSTQLDLVVKMRNALKGEGLKEAQKAIDDVNKALDANIIASEKAAEGNRDLGTAAAETGKKLEKTKESLVTGKKVFGVFADAMSAGISTMTNVGSSILNIAGAIGKLGITILSTPFKIFDAFVETAQTLPRNTAIVDALEDIRDAFGDIATGPGKAVASQLSTISKSARNLAGTGLSVTRVFGFGAEGIAGALKAVNELAQGTGESFTRLKGVFQESGLQLTMMQKGLGITAENMGQLMNIAELRGEDVGKTLEEFSKITLQTADEFGMGVKTMAKGMAELNVDVSTFGHLGPKAFAPMVVYAKKLGIEVKQLSGTMKKFSGFSDTAKAASELAQGFGMNIDAMKLMAEQNPAKKIDMLRKSFFNAGNDISKMSYQQKQYLEQTTGLEGTALTAAFSLEKQGLSYENIEKRANKAGKQQITQKKVMQDLGKQIKKLNHLMNVEKYAGFFDAFIKGFGVGLLKAGGMRGALKNIQKALLKVHVAGRQVAGMFVKYFPGVQTMLSAIGELFDPAKIDGFTDGIERAFKTLFQSKNGWGQFFTDIENVFEERAGVGGSILKKLKSGFNQFATFILKGITSGISAAVGQIGEKVLPAIQKFLDGLASDMAKEENKGKGLLSVLFQKASSSDITKKFGPLMEPVLGALQKAFTTLAPKVGKILETAWPLIKPYVMKLAGVMALSFAAGFAKSLIGGIASIGMSVIGANIWGGAKKSVEKASGKEGIVLRKTIGEKLELHVNSAVNKIDNTKIGKKLLEKFDRVALKFGPKIAAVGTKLIPIAGWVILIADAAVSISSQMDKMESSLQKDYGKLEGTIGAGSAGMLAALTLGLLPDTIYKTFGEGTASIVKSMRDMSKKIGMENIFDTYLATYRDVLKIFQGLGDVLIGLFEGDSERIGKGFGRMFDGIWSTLGLIPKLLFSAVLDLGPLLIKGFLKLVEFVALDIPIMAADLAYAFIKTIGDAIQNIWAAFDTKGFAGGMSSVFTEIFESPMNAVKEKWDGFVGWITKWAARFSLKVDVMKSKYGFGNEENAKEALKAYDTRQAKNAIKQAAEAKAKAMEVAKKDTDKKIEKMAMAKHKGPSWLDMIGAPLDAMKKMEAAKISAAEKKNYEKMSAARRMVSQVEDIADIEKKLAAATKKLAKINIKKLKKDVKYSVEKLGQIFSEIATVLDAGKLNETAKIIAPAYDTFSLAIDQTLVPIMKLNDKFIALKTGMLGITDSTGIAVKAMRKAPFTRLTKELPHMEAAILGIDKVVASVNTAGGKLTNENISKMKPVLDAIKDFKGGKLEVSHNLPNTEIRLSVIIDSKKLAEALVAVDLGKTPASTSPNARTYLATQKGQTKLPGSK